jgi:hypothetical protein
MFSINGTVNRPAGTAAINKTHLLDMYVTVGKLGRNTIQVKSSGVANGFAASIAAGLKLLKPITHAKAQKL